MELLGFFIAALVLPLGTLALFWFFTPREDRPIPASTPKSTPAPPAEGQQQQRRLNERVPALGNVSFSDAGALQPIGGETSLSAEAQAARQPTPSKERSSGQVPQSVSQADWIPACDLAVAALISLKIPKKESIALVRQAHGRSGDSLGRSAVSGIHSPGSSLVRFIQ